MNKQEIGRLQAKTTEHRFLTMLQHEFDFPPKIAELLLEEAKTCLQGSSTNLRPGQVRTILVKRDSSHTQTVADTPKVEVTWTIDAGLEDRQVQQQHGPVILRQVRIQRLLAEAIEQDGVASQEDLAQVLNVSVRSIKRDFGQMQAKGISLPSRGNLQGIGRGQTHKGQIIGRWLQGQTYDQIAFHTHHSLTAIKRYIQTFARVMELEQQGLADSQIALVVQIGLPLVREYLLVYQQNETPESQKRLQSQLQRLSGVEKRGQ